MSNIDDYGRPEPPIGADEIASIIGFFDYQIATLEWNSRVVDAAGLAKKVTSSTMTLGGRYTPKNCCTDQLNSSDAEDDPVQ